MARSDIYINTLADSPADAVVTAQQDSTAANVPDLVLGDTPLFNFYFTDNTANWPSWAGNAQYSITWALSDAQGGDVEAMALQTASTPISGGWAIRLPLNATRLIDQMSGRRVSQEYPVVRLWQQLRVTDPSGYVVTQAQLRTNLRLRQIQDTQVAPDDPLPTGTTTVLANADGTINSPANFFNVNSQANGYYAQANSSGNSTVAPGAGARTHVEIITFSGTARTSIVTLATAGRQSGDLCFLRLSVPATANIVVEVRNATTGGTLLSQLTTDTTGDDLALIYYFDGTAWQPFLANYPA